MNEFIIGALYTTGALGVLGVAWALISFIIWPFDLKNALKCTERSRDDYIEYYRKAREERDDFEKKWKEGMHR